TCGPPEYARALREPLCANHVSGVVERLPESREHLVDLTLLHDQRGAESHDVAGHVAQDHPVVLRASDEEGGDARLGIEALLGRLVAHDLDCADKADAAHIAD